MAFLRGNGDIRPRQLADIGTRRTSLGSSSEAARQLELLQKRVRTLTRSVEDAVSPTGKIRSRRGSTVSHVSSFHDTVLVGTTGLTAEELYKEEIKALRKELATERKSNHRNTRMKSTESGTEIIGTIDKGTMPSSTSSDRSQMAEAAAELEQSSELRELERQIRTFEDEDQYLSPLPPSTAPVLSDSEAAPPFFPSLEPSDLASPETQQQFKNTQLLHMEEHNRPLQEELEVLREELVLRTRLEELRRKQQERADAEIEKNNSEIQISDIEAHRLKIKELRERQELRKLRSPKMTNSNTKMSAVIKMTAASDHQLQDPQSTGEQSQSPSVVSVLSPIPKEVDDDDLDGILLAQKQKLINYTRERASSTDPNHQGDNDNDTMDIIASHRLQVEQVHRECEDFEHQQGDEDADEVIAQRMKIEELRARQRIREEYDDGIDEGEEDEGGNENDINDSTGNLIAMHQLKMEQLRNQEATSYPSPYIPKTSIPDSDRSFSRQRRSSYSQPESSLREREEILKRKYQLGLQSDNVPLSENELSEERREFLDGDSEDDQQEAEYDQDDAESIRREERQKELSLQVHEQRLDDLRERKRIREAISTKQFEENPEPNSRGQSKSGSHRQHRKPSGQVPHFLTTPGVAEVGHKIQQGDDEIGFDDSANEKQVDRKESKVSDQVANDLVPTSRTNQNHNKESTDKISRTTTSNTPTESVTSSEDNNTNAIRLRESTSSTDDDSPQRSTPNYSTDESVQTVKELTSRNEDITSREKKSDSSSSSPLADVLVDSATSSTGSESPSANPIHEDHASEVSRRAQGSVIQKSDKRYHTAPKSTTGSELSDTDIQDATVPVGHGEALREVSISRKASRTRSRSYEKATPRRLSADSISRRRQISPRRSSISLSPTVNKRPSMTEQELEAAKQRREASVLKFGKEVTEAAEQENVFNYGTLQRSYNPHKAQEILAVSNARNQALQEQGRSTSPAQSAIEDPALEWFPGGSIREWRSASPTLSRRRSSSPNAGNPNPEYLLRLSFPPDGGPPVSAFDNQSEAPIPQQPPIPAGKWVSSYQENVYTRPYPSVPEEYPSREGSPNYQPVDYNRSNRYYPVPRSRRSLSNDVGYSSRYSEPIHHRRRSLSQQESYYDIHRRESDPIGNFNSRHSDYRTFRSQRRRTVSTSASTVSDDTNQSIHKKVSDKGNRRSSNRRSILNKNNSKKRRESSPQVSDSLLSDTEIQRVESTTVSRRSQRYSTDSSANKRKSRRLSDAHKKSDSRYSERRRKTLKSKKERRPSSSDVARHSDSKKISKKSKPSRNTETESDDQKEKQSRHESVGDIKSVEKRSKKGTHVRRSDVSSSRKDRSKHSNSQRVRKSSKGKTPLARSSKHEEPDLDNSNEEIENKSSRKTSHSDTRLTTPSLKASTPIAKSPKKKEPESDDFNEEGSLSKVSKRRQSESDEESESKNCIGKQSSVSENSQSDQHSDSVRRHQSLTDVRESTRHSTRHLNSENENIVTPKIENKSKRTHEDLTSDPCDDLTSDSHSVVSTNIRSQKAEQHHQKQSTNSSQILTNSDRNKEKYSGTKDETRRGAPRNRMAYSTEDKWRMHSKRTANERTKLLSKATVARNSPKVTSRDSQSSRQQDNNISAATNTKVSSTPDDKETVGLLQSRKAADSSSKKILKISSSPSPQINPASPPQPTSQRPVSESSKKAVGEKRKKLRSHPTSPRTSSRSTTTNGTYKEINPTRDAQTQVIKESRGRSISVQVSNPPEPEKNLPTPEAGGTREGDFIVSIDSDAITSFVSDISTTGTGLNETTSSGNSFNFPEYDTNGPDPRTVLSPPMCKEYITTETNPRNSLPPVANLSLAKVLVARNSGAAKIGRRDLIISDDVSSDSSDDLRIVNAVISRVRSQSPDFVMPSDLKIFPAVTSTPNPSVHLRANDLPLESASSPNRHSSLREAYEAKRRSYSVMKCSDCRLDPAVHIYCTATGRVHHEVCSECKVPPTSFKFCPATGEPHPKFSDREKKDTKTTKVDEIKKVQKSPQATPVVQPVQNEASTTSISTTTSSSDSRKTSVVSPRGLPPPILFNDPTDNVVIKIIASPPTSVVFSVDGEMRPPSSEIWFNSENRTVVFEDIQRILTLPNNDREVTEILSQLRGIADYVGAKHNLKNVADGECFSEVGSDGTGDTQGTVVNNKNNNTGESSPPDAIEYNDDSDGALISVFANNGPTGRELRYSVDGTSRPPSKSFNFDMSNRTILFTDINKIITLPTDCYSIVEGLRMLADWAGVSHNIPVLPSEKSKNTQSRVAPPTPTPSVKQPTQRVDQGTIPQAVEYPDPNDGALISIFASKGTPLNSKSVQYAVDGIPRPEFRILEWKESSRSILFSDINKIVSLPEDCTEILNGVYKLAEWGNVKHNLPKPTSTPVLTTPVSGHSTPELEAADAAILEEFEEKKSVVSRTTPVRQDRPQQDRLQQDRPQQDRPQQDRPQQIHFKDPGDGADITLFVSDSSQGTVIQYAVDGSSRPGSKMMKYSPLNQTIVFTDINKMIQLPTGDQLTSIAHKIVQMADWAGVSYNKELTTAANKQPRQAPIKIPASAGAAASYSAAAGSAAPIASTSTKVPMSKINKLKKLSAITYVYHERAKRGTWAIRHSVSAATSYRRWLSVDQSLQVLQWFTKQTDTVPKQTCNLSSVLSVRYPFSTLNSWVGLNESALRGSSATGASSLPVPSTVAIRRASRIKRLLATSHLLQLHPSVPNNRHYTFTVVRNDKSIDFTTDSREGWIAMVTMVDFSLKTIHNKPGVPLSVGRALWMLASHRIQHAKYGDSTTSIRRRGP